MTETKLGRVSSVFVDEEINKVFVSVVTGPGVERREIPFLTSKPSMWLVPEEGDIVEVATVDRERVARFPHNPAKPQLPEGLGEGDVCLKLDDETELRFQKNDSGKYDITLASDSDTHLSFVYDEFVNRYQIVLEGGHDVTIESENDIVIESENDISVDAEESVFIDALTDIIVGEVESAVSVAIQDHTHDYSWTDSGGSGTTDIPNEDGTDTKIA